MKTRDYIFLSVLALVVCWAIASPSIPPDDAPDRRPRATFLQRVAKWAAIVFLVTDPAGEPAPLIQELPAHVVNAQPERTIGPDGAPLINHGDGW